MQKKRKNLALTDLPAEVPSLGSRALSPAELSLVIGGEPPGGIGGTCTGNDDFDGEGTSDSEGYD
jgi:hypothetical protein